MALKRQLGLGFVLVLGLQSCGKDKETKVVENPAIAQENEELKQRVAELEAELATKLQLGDDNVKLQAELASSTAAKETQEQLLRFAHAKGLVKPTELLAALQRAIAAAQNGEKKAKMMELMDFYKSVLPEDGDVAQYCKKLIAVAVENGLLTSDQGRDFGLEGTAPVFEDQKDINSRLLGVAPCEEVYSALFE